MLNTRETLPHTYGSPMSLRRRIPVVQKRTEPWGRGSSFSRRIWNPTDRPILSPLSCATRCATGRCVCVLWTVVSLQCNTCTIHVLSVHDSIVTDEDTREWLVWLIKTNDYIQSRLNVSFCTHYMWQPFFRDTLQLHVEFTEPALFIHALPEIADILLGCVQITWHLEPCPLMMMSSRINWGTCITAEEAKSYLSSLIWMESWGLL